MLVSGREDIFQIAAFPAAKSVYIAQTHLSDQYCLELTSAREEAGLGAWLTFPIAVHKSPPQKHTDFYLAEPEC